ncbi:hypothetical protein Dda_8764 [Drechslerella dactyloides]|uniref:Uncharacterized protein n=1 Tax=Drechslerella dactyloides TaxID=74499 RepID=A0AAD6IS24_DREDA|nr:hypothetical protein Dda_8764 [Drechslerella dactyloides]
MAKQVKVYRYKPSLAAAIVFVVAFSLTSALHTFQLSRTRTWFFIAFAVGGWFEVIGYVGRLVSVNQYPHTTKPPYVINILFPLVAPALYSASIYMALGRIFKITGGEKYSIIRPSWLTKIFVFGDIASFVIVGVGGSLVATADTADRADKGERIVIVGLIVHLVIDSNVSSVDLDAEYTVCNIRPSVRYIELTGIDPSEDELDYNLQIIDRCRIFTRWLRGFPSLTIVKITCMGSRTITDNLYIAILDGLSICPFFTTLKRLSIRFDKYNYRRLTAYRLSREELEKIPIDVPTYNRVYSALSPDNQDFIGAKRVFKRDIGTGVIPISGPPAIQQADVCISDLLYPLFPWQYLPYLSRFVFFRSAAATLKKVAIGTGWGSHILNGRCDTAADMDDFFAWSEESDPQADAREAQELEKHPPFVYEHVRELKISIDGGRDIGYEDQVAELLKWFPNVQDLTVTVPGSNMLDCSWGKGISLYERILAIASLKRMEIPWPLCPRCYHEFQGRDLKELVRLFLDGGLKNMQEIVFAKLGWYSEYRLGSVHRTCVIVREKGSTEYRLGRAIRKDPLWMKAMGDNVEHEPHEEEIMGEAKFCWQEQ